MSVTINLVDLRCCLGRFATGVCVVTAATPDGPHGLTVNSFTAVSLDPPLVLVSISRRARGHDLVAGRRFGINILGAEQELVARHFAGDPQPGAVHWQENEFAPRLAGTLAYIGCRHWQIHDGGDHTLYLGRVVEFEYRSGSALGYAYSRFTQVEEPVLGLEHIFG
jgi:flavin reductase